MYINSRKQAYAPQGSSAGHYNYPPAENAPLMIDPTAPDSPLEVIPSLPPENFGMLYEGDAAFPGLEWNFVDHGGRASSWASKDLTGLRRHGPLSVKQLYADFEAKKQEPWFGEDRAIAVYTKQAKEALLTRKVARMLGTKTEYDAVIGKGGDETVLRFEHSFTDVGICRLNWHLLAATDRNNSRRLVFANYRHAVRFFTELQLFLKFVRVSPVGEAYLKKIIYREHETHTSEINPLARDCAELRTVFKKALTLPEAVWPHLVTEEPRFMNTQHSTTTSSTASASGGTSASGISTSQTSAAAYARRGRSPPGRAKDHPPASEASSRAQQHDPAGPHLMWVDFRSTGAGAALVPEPAGGAKEELLAWIHANWKEFDAGTMMSTVLAGAPAAARGPEMASGASTPRSGGGSRSPSTRSIGSSLSGAFRRRFSPGRQQHGGFSSSTGGDQGSRTTTPPKVTAAQITDFSVDEAVELQRDLLGRNEIGVLRYAVRSSSGDVRPNLESIKDTLGNFLRYEATSKDVRLGSPIRTAPLQPQHSSLLFLLGAEGRKHLLDDVETLANNTERAAAFSPVDHRTDLDTYLLLLRSLSNLIPLKENIRNAVREGFIASKDKAASEVMKDFLKEAGDVGKNLRELDARSGAQHREVDEPDAQEHREDDRPTTRIAHTTRIAQGFRQLLFPEVPAEWWSPPASRTPADLFVKNAYYYAWAQRVAWEAQAAEATGVAAEARGGAAVPIVHGLRTAKAGLLRLIGKDCDGGLLTGCDAPKFPGYRPDHDDTLSKTNTKVKEQKDRGSFDVLRDVNLGDVSNGRAGMALLASLQNVVQRQAGNKRPVNRGNRDRDPYGRFSSLSAGVQSTADTPSELTLKTVQRVENPALWSQYLVSLRRGRGHQHDSGSSLGGSSATARLGEAPLLPEKEEADKEAFSLAMIDLHWDRETVLFQGVNPETAYTIATSGPNVSK
ncbi:unnamed protein product [Amoebophrya sp. A120]|nr:unnamed protein product [Amoebophrya sp. A120]|eukprot:GSA120T00007405001.1